MSRFIVYPYKMASESGKKLAQALNGLRVFSDRNYRPRPGDVIVNWGNSLVPRWYDLARGVTFLNRPENVALASNKLKTFRALQDAGVATPEFTDDPYVAMGWNDKVYARMKLTGHSGEGLIVVETSEQNFPVAPLYTRAISHRAEYRVHVFNGNVIDYRKKSRRYGEEDFNQQQSDVRNLGNGWVFRAQNLKRLERVENIAKEAVEALGLDFGAVDIIMAEDGSVYVLEVNTACAMEEQTLESYLEVLRPLT